MAYRWLAPVSYTHLDVYKRQGCDFSGLFYYDVNSGAVGTPYTMTASSPNVTSATSQPFAATGYGAAAQTVSYTHLDVYKRQL